MFYFQVLPVTEPYSYLCHGEQPTSSPRVMEDHKMLYIIFIESHLLVCF